MNVAQSKPASGSDNRLVKLTIVSALTAAAVLVFDLSIPLGVAGGVPYVALVLLGNWSRSRNYIISLAIVGSLLTIVGYLASPPGGVHWVVLTNRGLALFAIWVTAFLLIHRVRMNQLLRQSNEQLENRVLERTRMLSDEIKERKNAEIKLEKARDHLELRVDERTRSLHQEVTERKYAEKSLREGEARYRAVFESALDGIVTINDGGKIETANPQAEKIFGYDSGMLIGKEVSEFISSPQTDNNLGLWANLRDAKSDYSGHRLDTDGIRRDGSLFPIEIVASPMALDGKRKFVGIIRDVTDRRAAKIALKESETKFRDFTETASDWVWETDQELKFIGFSQKFFETMSIQSSDILGKSTSEYFGPDSSTGKLNTASGTWWVPEGIVDDRRSFKDVKTEFIDSDGEVHHLSLNGKPVYENGGEFAGYRGTGTEISNLVRAEKAAEEQKLRAEQFLEVSEAMIVDLDQYGNVASINNKTIELLEYDEDEILGRNWFDLAIKETDRDQVKEVFDALMKGKIENLEYYENAIFTRSGKEIFISWHNVLQTDSSGTITGTLSSGQNITERKFAELELNAAKILAEKANQAKSDFLSSMSHELRTPMNAILGFGQLLLNNPSESVSETQADYTNQILKSGDHLLELIDQVLDLAKIESGNVTLNVDIVDPHAVIDECIDMLVGRAYDAGVKIIFNEPNFELPKLATDKGRFRQILINLLSNAVKYNRQNGTVKISTQIQGRDYLRIKVQDTGLGVPKDNQEDLFEPFCRLGRESGDIEGSGIGLSITKELIDRMNGRIGFKSREGQGSTFWIDLPISLTQSIAEEDNAKVAKTLLKDASVYKSGNSSTILYIEDNPANLKLMKELISQLPDLNMLAAHNAEIGLEIAREKQPDLVLMDINLPGMNGIEALKNMQCHDRTMNIPVIALTAEARPEDKENGMAAGFKDYIVKPFDVSNVLNVIENVLS